MSIPPVDPNNYNNHSSNIKNEAIELLKLPEELITKILSMLDLSSLSKTSQTCKLLNRIFNDSSFIGMKTVEEIKQTYLVESESADYENYQKFNLDHLKPCEAEEFRKVYPIADQSINEANGKEDLLSILKVDLYGMAVASYTNKENTTRLKADDVQFILQNYLVEYWLISTLASDPNLRITFNQTGMAGVIAQYEERTFKIELPPSFNQEDFKLTDEQVQQLLQNAPEMNQHEETVFAFCKYCADYFASLK